MAYPVCTMSEIMTIRDTKIIQSPNMITPYVISLSMPGIPLRLLTQVFNPSLMAISPKTAHTRFTIIHVLSFMCIILHIPPLYGDGCKAGILFCDVIPLLACQLDYLAIIGKSDAVQCVKNSLCHIVNVRLHYGS